MLVCCTLPAVPLILAAFSALQRRATLRFGWRIPAAVLADKLNSMPISQPPGQPPGRAHIARGVEGVSSSENLPNWKGKY